MINYTERLTLLMNDVVRRVPTLAFIDVRDVLVFARHGRSSAEGAFATCHCLSLPPSEPGYYFWRDRDTGKITRRSDWFVTKSPTVSIGPRQVKYLISFTLPRFCDQSLDRSRKERFYPGVEQPWLAKLDTVIHELYHIDPDQNGIRRIDRGDGTYSANCHGHRFFSEVADMVKAYLATRPDPGVFEFLRHDFAALEAIHGGVCATTLPHLSVLSAALHRALREQPPFELDRRSVDVETIQGRAAAAALQRRRSPRPPLHARDVEAVVAKASSGRRGTRCAAHRDSGGSNSSSSVARPGPPRSSSARARSDRGRWRSPRATARARRS